MAGAIVGPGAMRAAAMLLVLVTALAGGQRQAVPVDPALAAFLQAGGVLADICGGQNGHGRDPARAPHCDACTPFTTPVAAAPAVGPSRVSFVPLVSVPAPEPVRRVPARSPCGPRAPPAVLI